MEVAHIDTFRREPDRFWHFYGDRFASLVRGSSRTARTRRSPSSSGAGTYAVSITQNIDRLHRKAGSEEVVEVHGSIEWSSCQDCGGRVPIERVLEILASAPGAPECEACISPLKPDVVLFGELLPDAAINRAYELAAEADLLICVGSSLEVFPVASLPGVTRENGGRLAIVTQGPTPYDARGRGASWAAMWWRSWTHAGRRAQAGSKRLRWQGCGSLASERLSRGPRCRPRLAELGCPFNQVARCAAPARARRRAPLTQAAPSRMRRGGDAPLRRSRATPLSVPGLFDVCD